VSLPLGLPRREPAFEWDIQNEQHALGAPLQVHAHGLSLSLLMPDVMTVHGGEAVETPLSATEQEMFHALCSSPDWEKENTPPAGAGSGAEGAVRCKGGEEPEGDDVVPERGAAAGAGAGGHAERPLRRSKRVANAMAVAARTRTRTCRRSARNSLS
jgi:hypothetical protein